MPENDQNNSNSQHNGDMDLPAEMFRSGENVKELKLKVPRMNMNFMGQVKKVNYSEVEGLALFEGDIVLGSVEEVEEAQSGAGDRGITIDGDRFRWGQKENGRVKKVVVPYMVVPELEQVVKDAIAHWEKHTPIRFVKLTTEQDYISFEKLNGCYSRIGRQGGRQVISLGSGCGLGSAIHEIGHTLGLFHEQSREDRDQHIQVIKENIITVFMHNFDKHILDASDQGPYDFGSIMHYPETAFSKNGKPTIKTAAGQPIGQRQGLSKGDIQAIKAIYPDLNWPPA